MADITSICNQALAAIGTRTTISSINEASNEARQCLLQYEPTRRHLLRAAHWGFAKEIVYLAVVKAHRSTPGFRHTANVAAGAWDQRFEPPPPWLYAYSLNTEILAVRYILPATMEGTISPPIFGTNAISYDQANSMGPMVKFETGILVDYSEQWVFRGFLPVLLTNMPQALVCFTRNVTDPNFFDESFLRAFVQALAANMTTALTGDLKLYDALTKMTNNFIMEARLRSANEGLNAIDIMPDWFRVRGMGPSVGTGPWIAEYGPLFGGVS